MNSALFKYLEKRGRGCFLNRSCIGITLFSLILFTGLQDVDAADPSVSFKWPCPKGEVVGPVEDGEGSSYLLYVPKSVSNDRDVPLLFYTNAGGGAASFLKRIAEGAELTGWVLAMSIQSKNGLNREECLRYSRNSIEHILDTLPIDKKRLYFTGNSGGGAQAFYNADQLNACGLIPSVGYIPNNCAPPRCHCFIINGGWDYNRYPSAVARKRIGKRLSVHRFHDGGHTTAPDWLMVEGMLWLEGKYLSAKGDRAKSEQKFFEDSVVQWIQKLKEKEPHRAYYWTLFLQEELSLSSENRTKMNQLIEILGADEKNQLYVEGLEAIDKLSNDKLSKFGAGSRHNHSDKSVVSACDKLLEEYGDVPLVKEILKALRRSTT